MELLALSLALPTAPADVPPGFQTGTVRWSGRPAARVLRDLRPAMDAVHNAARREYGVPALAWDAALARDAARWAQSLARGTRFAHDRQAGASMPQGENLFRGTRGAFTYQGMAQLWVDERRWFRKGRFPDVVTSGPWTRVGHYTQIIWPGTRRYGCAVASSARNDFLVCRYLPAGNYIGVELR